MIDLHQMLGRHHLVVVLCLEERQQFSVGLHRQFRETEREAIAIKALARQRAREWSRQRHNLVGYLLLVCQS